MSQSTIIDVVWKHCKACLPTQNRETFVPFIQHLHRYLEVPLTGGDTYQRYIEVVESLRLRNKNDIRRHNAFSRTLVLLLAAYQLYWSKREFGYGDIYKVVEEILGGRKSFWSGKPSKNFEANVRTAILEHCSASSQFWFRHNTFLTVRCIDIFQNDYIHYENQRRSWVKGNIGKRRRGPSLFMFNTTLEQPSEETVAYMHNIALTRNNEYEVLRSDGGAKHFWDRDIEKILIYPQTVRNSFLFSNKN